MTMKNPQKQNSYIIYTAILLFSISIFYLILGEYLLPVEPSFSKYEYDVYDSSWSLVLDDGSRLAVLLPNTFDIKPGKELVLETILPEDFEAGTCLCFRSNHEDFFFYLDGELLDEFTYSTVDTRLWGDNSQSAYVFIDLDPSYQGKTLQIRVTSLTAYSGIMSYVYIGTRIGIWGHIIHDNLIEIAIALAVFILGFICTIFGMIFRLHYKEEVSLEYIGFGSIVASMWVFSNSNLRQLIFPNISVVSDIPFLMIALMPAPLLLFINSLQKNRYQYIHHVIAWFSILNFVVIAFLQVTNISNFLTTFYSNVLFLGLGIVAMVATCILDAFNGYIKEYYASAIGIFMACGFGIFEIVLYILKIYDFNGMMICIALLFIMGGTGILAVSSYRQKVIERNTALQSSQSKGQFLANMSHEIRTPINAVLGMDEMILRDSSEANIREYALDIQHAGQTLLSLINDILDYSKIENGKLEILPVDYQLSSIINDSYNMIAPKLKDKPEIKMDIKPAKNLPKILHGDEVRIRQICVNFLTNAVKYTEEGTITFRVDGQKVDDTTFNLIIEVEDTGMGIKEDDLKKLFDSFQRVDETKNRNIEGTGLGLSIVAELVSLMNGKIDVDSVYGQGSTFTAIIPQAILSDEVMNSLMLQFENIGKSSDTHNEDFFAPNSTILVVDDVDMNLKVVKGLLKNTELKIDTANSGMQALDLLAEKKYDIVFLDHMMPEMDGIETLQKLREIEDSPNKDTPVIMLTANALAGAKEKYLAVGFQDYLSKPIQQEALKEMLIQYLPKEDVKLMNQQYESPNSELSFLEQLNQFLNTDAGMEYYGNEDFYREVLEAYVDDGDINKLQIPFEEENWSEYEINAHSLKSSSIYIGAEALSEEALRLENACKQNTPDYIKAHHDSVIRMYSDTLSRIKEVLNNNPV